MRQSPPEQYNGVLYLLQKAVDQIYEQAGVYDGSIAKWPTVKDVLVKAQNMDARGRESGWLSSTLRALSTIRYGCSGDTPNQ
jgi:hypothetical protein